MISGVQLSLRIGPVPMAAPREVTDALVSVKVMDGSGGTQSGFEMVFELPARSPLRTLFLLTGGASGLPMMRIVLIVTINGVAQSIIDGVVTNVETQPGDGGVVASGRQGQGPVGADGNHRDSGLAVPRDAARRCACC